MSPWPEVDEVLLSVDDTLPTDVSLSSQELADLDAIPIYVDPETELTARYDCHELARVTEELWDCPTKAERFPVRLP